MIDFTEAGKIHEILIEKFGGTKGIRDKGALEAALKRPYATFDQKDLYPTAIDKAAAILESIISNHPFVDGNKRTGYVIMRLSLMESGLDIKSDQADKYKFVTNVANSNLNIDQIKEWIKKRIQVVR